MDNTLNFKLFICQKEWYIPIELNDISPLNS